MVSNEPGDPAGEVPVETIRLVIPARPEFVEVARTATSALAFGCGLASGEVDGVCEAVQVALGMLNELSPQEAAELRFKPRTGQLSVDVQALRAAAPGLSVAEQFALHAQLAVFVDAIEFNEGGTSVGFRKETQPATGPLR